MNQINWLLIFILQNPSNSKNYYMLITKQPGNLFYLNWPC
nr:MAG TPA: hypothetical protein [Caudoviricetes sp.]